MSTASPRRIRGCGEDSRAPQGDGTGIRPRPVVAGKLLGPVLWWTSRREDQRLAAGQTYEPTPIIDRRNWVAEPGRSATARAVGVPSGSARRLAPDLITLETGNSSSCD